jgi:hypothetical protein
MKKITLLFSSLFLATASYGQVVLAAWEVSGITDLSSGSSPYTFAAQTTETNISSADLTIGFWCESSNFCETIWFQNFRSE